MIDNNYIYITTQSACIDEENKAWFFSNEFNGLFCKSLPDGKTEYVRSFEKEDMFTRSLYTHAFYYDYKIAFIPCNAKNIAIYDTVKDIVHYIPMYNEEYLIYFNSVKINENSLLLFPVQYSKQAYILDMTNQEIESINLDFGNYEGDFSKDLSKTWFIGSGYDGNKVYIAIFNSNKFIAFDLKTKEIKFYEYPNNDLYCIGGKGREIVLLEVNGQNIARLGEYEQIKLTSRIQNDVFKNGNQIAYTHICTTNNEIILMPVYGNNLIVIKNNKLINIELDNAMYEIIRSINQPFATASTDKNGNIYLFPYQADKLVIILKNGSAQFDKLVITEEDYREILLQLNKWHLIKKNNLEVSEDIIPLTMFIDLISDIPIKEGVNQEGDSIGKKIWNSLKNNY